MQILALASVDRPKRGSMSKWVIRHDLDGNKVGSPEMCLVESRGPQVGGLKTVDECIASLLAPHETAEAQRPLRKILIRDEVVGFISVSEQRPPD